jgi:hydroxypyruvate isomerase
LIQNRQAPTKIAEFGKIVPAICVFSKKWIVMPNFAANLSMLFTELPFLDRFDAAAQAGFRHVECQFPYDFTAAEITARLQYLDLNLVLFNLPPGNWADGERGLAALSTQQTAFRQSIELAIAYAQACRTSRLHALAGIANPLDHESLETYRDNLNYAAHRLTTEGMTLLIEPINRHDMPGYFLSDFDFAADLIQTIGRSNLQLQFDVYHRQMICGDIIKGLRKFMPIIGHIQIAGVPGRHEPVACELDFPTIFAEIDALGYGGYVGCEYRPRAGTVDGLDWLSPYLPQQA